ncbi:hypothetical protein FQR65_LT03795 [Abscondita terminalis]|nr:hypothetical protein FQR65_LT03795 [Abscondita terminalis]
MHFLYAIIFCLYLVGAAAETKNASNNNKTTKETTTPCPCSCGVFLSGQFVKGSKQPPKGNPALLQEMDNPFVNNAVGNRQCINKCLELIIKHLSKSADILCASIDRDCHKEKAHLFIKNHNCQWMNSNLSAGREFCCKDNEPYKC